MAFESRTIMPGFRVHVKHTKQFKTTTVRIFLARNLDRHTTHAALLPYILRRGTRSHPSMTRISRHLENLYGTAVGTDISKLGEWQILSFVADAPNEKHLRTRIPVLDRVFEFLRELIFCPAGNNGFIEDYFETERDNLRKFIASLPDNHSSYAFERLLELMCEGEPFARFEYGSIRALARLRPEPLFRFYTSLVRRTPIDIYVLGDVRPENIFGRIGSLFAGFRNGRYRLIPPVLKSARRRPQRFEERTPAAQAKLLMGYRCSAPFGSTTSHALALAAAVLGGFAHSKLFRFVREKSSLAYAVGTHMMRSKGMMIAYAGVEPGREAKAQKLIEQQVAQLKNGRVSRFELDSTRSSIIDDLSAITDSPSKEIDFHFVNLLHGQRVTPQEIAEKVRKTTKEEIVAAARKLKLDTVFVLTDGKPEIGKPPV